MDSQREDNETRAKLLNVAARLFGERGFNHVSVRKICQEAGTNVASVNYHFRDKLGLYRELIGLAAVEMNQRKVAVLDSGKGQSAEEQLRAYIRGFMRQLFDQDPSEKSWMEKLIAREMAEPTPALDLIIEKGIKPSNDRLSLLISEVVGLPVGDRRVLMSAGAIQGLCIWYKSSRTVAEHMVPGLRFTQEVVDGLAEFVAKFSLAGMRALAQQDAGHELALKSPAGS
jgi:AcrR family transcriptional regulator